jgi:hypothetical protein
MATTTNYGWTTPDNTALVKDGAAAIRTLGSSIDTTLKAQIDAQIPDSLLTTTGDTIYASGASTPARLGIGTTGQVLTVAGGLPTWATASAGGQTLISTTSLSGTSVTISSIPSGYKHLQLVFQNMSANGTGDLIWLRINGVTAANSYGYGIIKLEAGTIGNAWGANENRGFFTYSVNQATVYKQTQGTITLSDYGSSTTKQAQMLMQGFTGAGAYQTLTWLNFVSTSAITSLTIGIDGGTTFSSGSVLLYGVS